MVNWYEFAKNVIAPFIMGGCTDEDSIVKEIDRLYAATPANDYQETPYRTNAEELTAFLDSCDEVTFDGLAIAQGEPDPPQLLLSGVDVSVRPEFTIEAQNWRLVAASPVLGLVERLRFLGNSSFWSITAHTPSMVPPFSR
jgi:hypothetical protein